jgi:hypothetical protein
MVLLATQCLVLWYHQQKAALAMPHIISLAVISKELRSSSVSNRKSFTDLGSRFRKPNLTLIREKTLGKTFSTKGKIVAVIAKVPSNMKYRPRHRVRRSFGRSFIAVKRLSRTTEPSRESAWRRPWSCSLARPLFSSRQLI